MRAWTLSMVGLLLATGAAGAAEGAPAAPAEGHAGHKALTSEDLVWVQGPPGLPPGATLSVLDGDPAAAGAFTIRLFFPDGYKIAPHRHPNAEHATVLAGALHLGTGDTVDAAKATKLGVGGFVAMPAEMAHWAWTEGQTIVQIHGTGPFAINYVNPADDPRQAKPATP